LLLKIRIEKPTAFAFDDSASTWRCSFIRQAGARSVSQPPAPTGQHAKLPERSASGIDAGRHLPAALAGETRFALRRISCFSEGFAQELARASGGS